MKVDEHIPLKTGSAVHRNILVLFTLLLLVPLVEVGFGVPEKIIQIQTIDTLANQMTFHCLTSGNHTVKLYYTFPTFGGLRIHSNTAGFFNPASLATINYGTSGTVLTATTGLTRSLAVNIQKNPLQIKIMTGSGRVVYTLNDSDMVVTLDSITNKLKAGKLCQQLQSGEALYGLGDRWQHINFRGDSILMYQCEEVLTPSGPRYKAIPFYHSTAGYSLFLNSTYKSSVVAGSKNPNRMWINIDGPIFDFYVWGNGPLQALQSYTDLTGKPMVPPKWAFEPMAGGGSQVWRLSGHTPASIANRFKTEDIPHSAIYLEGNSSQSNITSMNTYGLRTLGWHNMQVTGSAPAVSCSDGSTFSDPVYGWRYTDYTNPVALTALRLNMATELANGLKGSMIDFGDALPPTLASPAEAVLYNGRRGAQMHNFYSYDYNRIWAQVFSEKWGNDYYLFSRSATPGTQAIMTQMSGDEHCTYVGLTQTIIAGLSLCASGFSNWSSDIGGYYNTTLPPTLVYDVWIGYGVFSPQMRFHGQSPREPWYFAPDTQTVRLYKQYAWLRENMLNYNYSNAIYAHKTGIPMMRILHIDYPDQPTLVLNSEYMFGQDILVRPVTDILVTSQYSASSTKLKVIFPPGRWVHYWSKKIYGNPFTITSDSVLAPCDQIPFFLKEGSIIPLRLNAQLKPGASMTPGSVSALMVTPPLSMPSVRPFYKSEDTVTTYTSTTGTSSFTIQADQIDKTPYILVYGATVTGVKIGARDISQLQALPATIGTEGWFADKLDTGRVIICLPTAGWNSVTISTSGTSNNSIRAYPNPLNTAFSLYFDTNRHLKMIVKQNGTYECHLLAPDGSIVTDVRIRNTGNYNLTHDKVPSGVYFLKLQSIGGTLVQRILVK